MGRTKSAMVKRASRKMLEEENQFKTKFEDNKKVLGHTMPSKLVRNKVAGYLARLKRMQLKDQIQLK
jgi:ribosomal protein S17E